MHTSIAFDERVTFFGLNVTGHCLVNARLLLHCMCVHLCNGYSLCANNATYTQAQGSEAKKLTLLLKAIKL